MMPKVSGACNYQNVTNHEMDPHISLVKVLNTRSLSSNSSTKSFDVDLTEMVHREEAKCNNHENLAVPTYLPLKKQLRSRRYVPSEALCFPDTGNMTDRESDPRFSEIQSEFDCKLLSGALCHKGEIFEENENHVLR